MNAMTIMIPKANEPRKVLLLCGSDPGTALLKEILARHAEVASASDIPSMRSQLAEDGCDLLICDWRFSMGTWRDALEGVRHAHPDLPVLVVCRSAGEREWREVLEAGAFDLLTEPYSERAVLSVVEHAFASRDARATRSVA